MKLAIVGSRDFNDFLYMKKKVAEFGFAPGELTEIVSGGARGADSLAEQLAVEWNLWKKVFPAEWDKYGKSAGYRRNELIVEYSDMIFAFWDGKSKGTQHTINLTKRYGKPIYVFTDWKENGTLPESSNAVKTNNI